MKSVIVESLDDFGRGIARVNEKVVFIDDALPGEIVDIEIISDKKKYCEAKVENYIKLSDSRVESKCPYFKQCGGCQLLNLSYEDTIAYKQNKIKNLLAKNKIDYKNSIEIIKNESPFNYRNKVSLKIINGVIGYYKNSTHELVSINNCPIANEEINKVISNYKILNIMNGNITIRCNYNKEILLVIDSEDELNIDIDALKKHVKLVGIVYNNKCIFNNSFFYEKYSGMLFKVSYNSFFQINPFITKELFNIVKENIVKNDVVLDLYSGVGTLSIVAAKKAKKVYSVEIIRNAVLNGIFNSKLNKQDNIRFMLGDTAKVVNKITENIDTIIVDPPRSGLDKVTKSYILKNKPKKVIYISCDPLTLMRDLKEFSEDYEIIDYKILDMFSYSYHTENICILKKMN